MQPLNNLLLALPAPGIVGCIGPRGRCSNWMLTPAVEIKSLDSSSLCRVPSDTTKRFARRPFSSRHPSTSLVDARLVSLKLEKEADLLNLAQE